MSLSIFIELCVVEVVDTKVWWEIAISCGAACCTEKKKGKLSHHW